MISGGTKVPDVNYVNENVALVGIGIIIAGVVNCEELIGGFKIF